MIKQNNNVWVLDIGIVVVILTNGIRVAVENFSVAIYMSSHYNIYIVNKELLIK